MKIVNILGGLGNQMFQYALAEVLKILHPEHEIRIDPSGFNGYPLHNGYELKRIFKVPIPEASALEQMRVYYPLRNYRMWQFGNRLLPWRKTIVRESSDMHFDPKVLSHPGNAYYIGYWQTEMYFKQFRDKILSVFTFPSFELGSRNDVLKHEISNKRSVSVHVRRGDYTKIANTQGICTADYYRKALELMQKQTKPEILLVFSDDTEWCKSNLGELFKGIDTVYVDWNKGTESFRDMQLMSLCHYNVIANSSFSWWGAWLNDHKEKTVISPSKWMVSEGWVNVIPEGWLAI